MSFQYKLIYVRGKRGVSITVKDGAVSVRAPKGLSAADAEKILLQKKAWIEKKLSEQARQYGENRDFIEYSRFLLLGETFDSAEELRAALCRVEPSRAGMKLPRRADPLCGEGGGDGKPQPNKNIKPLIKLYKSAAQPFLERRLFQIAAQMEANAPDRNFQLSTFNVHFKLINSRAKWGCCETGGAVSLNWRLILLPPALMDYVIVHELCHFGHMNHSRDFWRLVSAHLPDYTARRKSLKKYGFVIKLFR
ncbi:MAG: M48 family metallopeptidase [Clostridiales bacterium]|jgi:predicted metal-dependent hydrolase|nr:M48 family metallopeptidase [Clostridiales bacterium]